MNAPVQRFNCISVLFRFWSRVLWSAAASASRLICTSAPPYTCTSCVPFGRLGRASEGERVRGRRHAQCCGMWWLGCISKDSVVGVCEGFCSYFNMPYGELHLTLVEGQDLKDGKIIMCCTQLCRYRYHWCSSNDVT